MILDVLRSFSSVSKLGKVVDIISVLVNILSDEM
jgi:hypothetical protein